ncbi:ATP-binding protein [Streptodolium elevatio]|uniref:ATP-binding protein n=1 Tax=Streptodolium elevatio TaxID=3157996 RepID=A0ABV3DGD1_9ACTN
MSTTRSHGMQGWSTTDDGHRVLVVDLDGMPGSVRDARHATTEFLAGVRVGRRLDAADAAVSDVLLVVAELVANACRHAPGPCRLTVTLTNAAAEIAVQDTAHGYLPIAGRRGRPAGYGLLIVTRLTGGIHVLPAPDGKIVRATVPLPGLWPRPVPV